MNPPGAVRAAAQSGVPVLVAGGSSALGGAVIAALLAAGHPVSATYRRHPPVADEGQPGEVGWMRVDLTDPSEVAAAVDAVTGLGAVVNLAGGYTGGVSVHETSPDALDCMLRLNLLPVFLLARAAMPKLIARGGGAFVGVSARAAVRPFAGAAAYITAKAGVLALIQSLDAEYGRHNVRANAIVPGVIDTPANRKSQPDADRSRWVRPEDIAHVIEFLVSNRSSAVRGATIPV